MGLQVKDLIIKEEIALKDLQGKVLAVDSMNLLYQFLTTIRGVDGSLLTDSHGNVTSHLIGLFSRTTSLMQQGLKLVFVFDGKPPEIKRKTWEKRTAVKKEAALKLREAQEIGDEESARKYAGRTAVLTKDMVDDAKALIGALGLPIVQAPSEGEAQTAYMVKKGDVYASVSQDYDNLIFGCPVLVRNLSIEGRRKKAGAYSYSKINPEIIRLEDVLNHLGISLEQLIVLAVLVGTDYNPGGVKGIGPKKALKLVKEFPEDFSALFAEVKWGEAYPDLSWEEVYDTVKNIPVTGDYTLEWKPIDEKELRKVLIEKHGFGEERVNSKLEKIKERQHKGAQKGLGSFF